MNLDSMKSYVKVRADLELGERFAYTEGLRLKDHEVDTYQVGGPCHIQD